MRCVARITTLLVAAMLAGCASMFSAGEIGPDDEVRLVHEAQRSDEAIARSGQLYEDAELTAYVQSVMDRLHPDGADTLTVRLFKAPDLNAFALPNGSIYFNLGLLVRLDNEAQLATVLAHEAAHVTHRHGLQQRRVVKRSTALASVVSVLHITLAGDLLAASSIYGYSRDLEREADRRGFERLKQAGYATAEAPRTFEHLAAEVAALKIEEPYFFSSHPRLRERIESFEGLLAEQPSAGGEIGVEVFLARTARARIWVVETDLSMNRFQSVLLALEDPQRRGRYGEQASYYLAEAYRRRHAEGDAARAESYYREAIAAAPAFAPSYRSLGLLQFERRDYADAEANLRRYLELAPQADDRGYMEQYLREIDRQGAGR